MVIFNSRNEFLALHIDQPALYIVLVLYKNQQLYFDLLMPEIYHTAVLVVINQYTTANVS